MAQGPHEIGWQVWLVMIRSFSRRHGGAIRRKGDAPRAVGLTTTNVAKLLGTFPFGDFSASHSNYSYHMSYVVPESGGLCGAHCEPMDLCPFLISI